MTLCLAHIDDDLQTCTMYTDSLLTMGCNYVEIGAKMLHLTPTCLVAGAGHTGPLSVLPRAKTPTTYTTAWVHQHAVLPLIGSYPEHALKEGEGFDLLILTPENVYVSNDAADTCVIASDTVCHGHTVGAIGVGAPVALSFLAGRRRCNRRAILQAFEYASKSVASVGGRVHEYQLYKKGNS